MTISGSEIAKPSWETVLDGMRRDAGRTPRLVWTVNRRDVVERLAAFSVSGLIGDDPAALAAWVTEVWERSDATDGAPPPGTRP